MSKSSVRSRPLNATLNLSIQLCWMVLFYERVGSDSQSTIMLFELVMAVVIPQGTGVPKDAPVTKILAHTVLCTQVIIHSNMASSEHARSYCRNLEVVETRFAKPSVTRTPVVWNHDPAHYVDALRLH
nr:hypothetical protein CFP56_11129 [Quercus suber]